MYSFILQRGDTGEGETMLFPLAPEQFNTSVGNKNKTIELISIGEVNVVKDIGLRTFNFDLLLPKNDALLNEGGIENAAFHEPIWYLNRLREIKVNKEIVYLVIVRKYVDGTNADGSKHYKNLFGGNLKVTIEDYKVEENAGEEGDYWVSLNLKEYKEVGITKELIRTGKVENNKVQVTEVAQRKDERVIPDTYTVKKGDTLWAIAQLYYGDGSKYKTIMTLNNLTTSDLTVGQVLKLK